MRIVVVRLLGTSLGAPSRGVRGGEGVEDVHGEAAEDIVWGPVDGGWGEVRRGEDFRGEAA